MVEAIEAPSARTMSEANSALASGASSTYCGRISSASVSRNFGSAELALSLER